MIKSLLTAVVLLIVLAVCAAGLWAWQGLAHLETPVTLQQPLLFEVPSGHSYTQVARDMEQQDLISEAFWLRLYGRLNPEQTRVQAGEYEFTDGMSPRRMLTLMVQGQVKTRSVQFIEGQRFIDARAALAAAAALSKETTDWTGAEIMAALGAEGQHPEGRFFPDTYRYTRSETDLAILKRAYERMNRVLDEEWQARAEDLPYETPYDALIMASIVERETGAPHEREDVAGVFVRRLRMGMRLQTDPTVIYGMGEAYQGRITRKDLTTHTPYNTYRISGLPPTPIALPGREAIHAALNPASGDALYFVAKGDGTHKFSRTLEEHRKAVREYQLQRRQDYRSSPAPAEAAE